MNKHEQLRHWLDHPAAMVRDLFKVEPEAWQEDALEAFPHHQRICMKASKGVGKTALEAWLIWNFLLTRPHPKIACCAINAANLADNLWTELAFWQQKSELLKAAFTWTKTRIFANDHPETWWCSARSWSQSADKSQQANTLAGLHADYIMFVLDESGGMPEAIMPAASAALSSCKEGHIIQAGNPTHLEGPLWRACSSERNLWHVVEINADPDNPKRASRVSIEWARQEIQAHGRDNPYVLINVFGQFPPSSLNALIGPDEVAAAMRRVYTPHHVGSAPRILGVDVARFGDDGSVIAARHGIQAMNFEKRRGLDSIQGAGWVARKWSDWNPDGVFIDDTGGFGAGWIDNLRQLGRAPIGVPFSGAAHDRQRYANKRAEMYFDLVAWIKGGGALPDCPELTAALTQTSYTFQRDALILEPKDVIKAKLGYSPDEADALALTFAAPVAAASQQRQRFGRHTVDYDPFASITDAMDRTGGHTSEYDPFGSGNGRL